MSQLARVAARRYKRKCWWVDERDLEQAAWVAMLEAQKTFDESVGIEREAYLWAAIIHKLHREVLHESSPVSASNEYIEELRGLYRAPVNDEKMPDYLCPASLFERHERQHIIRTGLERSLQHLGSVADVAMSVLVGGKKPREITKETQIPVREVYTVVRKARKAMQNDGSLWEVFQEYR